MIKITKLTAANTSRSLRTTVPSSVVKALDLTSNSYLSWNVVKKEGETYIQVERVR